MNTTAQARMVDLAFAVQGHSLPREHRQALAAAVEAVLPWLAELPGAGMHRLNVSAGGGARALLSQRTRLTLRVPRDRQDDARQLEDRTLDLAGEPLRIGRAQARELLPWGTLYAHLVAVEGTAASPEDEVAFLRQVEAGLAALGVQGRPICGRLQTLPDDALQGYSLMVDGLSADSALRMLEAGLGAHRRLGCGLFVPHKSAAAVGSPP